MLDRSTGFQQIHLASTFVFDGPTGKAHRVEVFDLATLAELFRSFPSHRDIAIATQRTFFHIAIGNFQVADQLAHGAHKGIHFLRVPHIRLGDDLQKRHPGPVEIDQAMLRLYIMDGFAGILFHVNMVNAGSSWSSLWKEYSLIRPYRSAGDPGLI